MKTITGCFTNIENNGPNFNNPVHQKTTNLPSNSFGIFDTNLKDAIERDIIESNIIKDLFECEDVPAESNKINLFKENLKQWAINFNITHCALTKLLHILAPLDLNLPLDSRTFLKTPVKFVAKKLDTGKYCHLGFQQGIENFLISYSSYLKENIISISFNIDGLPLFHSSNTQIWPFVAKASKPYLLLLVYSVAVQSPNLYNYI